MNPVVHFEMPFEDRERVAAFYTKAFGWKPQMMGEEYGNYIVMHTSETKPDGFPTEPGRINGGMFPKTPDNQYPSVVVAVDDIYAAMKKVEEAGGKVLPGSSGKPGEPDDIPGIGLYSAVIDTEGNRISMLQPKPMR